MLIDGMTLGSNRQRKRGLMNESDIGEESENQKECPTHVGIVNKRRAGAELLEVLGYARHKRNSQALTANRKSQVSISALYFRDLVRLTRGQSCGIPARNG